MLQCSMGVGAMIRGMADIGRRRGSVPNLRRRTWWGRLWAPFWAVPAALALLALGLGVALPEADRWLRENVLWVFPGGPDAARDVLTTIASAMISTTGVVFSITMVVLQLASSQFTPRVLGGFLASRVVQATFGVFIGTFVFSLTVLRSVLDQTDTDPGFVPRVSVSFAVVLALACVALLLAFIRHITEMIQVSRVILRVGNETMALVERVFPGVEEHAQSGPRWSPGVGTPRHDVVLDDRHGQVDEIDLHGLVRLAEQAEGVFVLDTPLGSFRTRGQRVGVLWDGKFDDEFARGVNAALELTNQRSMRQDITFGLRQLVDIGERALSPGVNDPTTAVQVIDELHRILREVVQRQPPSPYLTTGDGTVRVVAPTLSATDVVRLAIEELAHYGANSIQIPRRLEGMLADLASCALPQYRDSINRLGHKLGAASPGMSSSSPVEQV